MNVSGISFRVLPFALFILSCVANNKQENNAEVTIEGIEKTEIEDTLSVSAQQLLIQPVYEFHELIFLIMKMILHKIIIRQGIKMNRNFTG